MRIAINSTYNKTKEMFIFEYKRANRIFSSPFTNCYTQIVISLCPSAIIVERTNSREKEATHTYAYTLVFASALLSFSRIRRLLLIR